MGCATSLVKYIVFLFNLAFVLAGIAFIAIGVIFKLDIEDFTAALNKTEINFSLAPTLLIIVGSIVFVISFFGCCGAVRESTCMLTTYAIILLTLFLLQVALGVYAFIQFKDSDAGIKNEIHEELKKTLELYDKDNVARETIDALQSERECCGVDSPADWRQVWNNDSLPSSCCRNLPPQCRASDGDSYRKGCFDPLYNFLQETIKMVGIVVVVIGATEIIGAIIALCLSSSIRNHERRGNYA